MESESNKPDVCVAKHHGMRTEGTTAEFGAQDEEGARC